ncbi:hypothetical protein ACFVWG_28800 [Kribbella sp. NPDC058245]|uniref:hypothetical protein n=1 Tax=Kribbella sp. NPDC058245 TaxID=3346399 RepID=UPI0036E7F18F
MAGSVFFPHCDLHILVGGGVTVSLKQRFGAGAQHVLRAVSREKLAFDFFAPYKALGSRRKELPEVDGNGRLQSEHPGVYLFQVRVIGTDEYIVGRVQVHSEMTDWWFGNKSLTTAVENDTVVDGVTIPALGHALPSVYAKFSPNDPHVDLIGDITAHGYIRLASSNENLVRITGDGRLRGVAETTAPVEITGTLPGGTPKPLPVRAVNYRATRKLDKVKIVSLAAVESTHTMLFVADGFTQDEKGLFEERVRQATAVLLSQKRHQPYPMLADDFNIFSHFTASQERLATIGPPLTAAKGGDVKVGSPIPTPASAGDEAMYDVDRLVALVGLPPRGETRDRDELVALWTELKYASFDKAKVDRKLVEAWKAQVPAGILQARDTVLGMSFGARLADRESQSGGTEVKPPTDDTDIPENIRDFVQRLHQFFVTQGTSNPVPDPRRHPPELRTLLAPDLSLMQLIGNLELNPGDKLGTKLWVRQRGTFKPSAGMIGVICNEPFSGGTNFHEHLAMATSLGATSEVSAALSGNVLDRVNPPAGTPTHDYGRMADLIAHEFGHSFNLADEYETAAGRHPDADSIVPEVTDNLVRYHSIADTQGDNKINPANLKWAKLLRARISSILQEPATSVAGRITVRVSSVALDQWAWAEARKLTATLRLRHIDADGQQLSDGPNQPPQTEGLSILVDRWTGMITLSKTGLAAGLEFPAGTLLYVPVRDKAGTVLVATDPNVIAYIATQKKPLNKDLDNFNPKSAPDEPVSDMPNVKMPHFEDQLIGVYEGGDRFPGGIYRPAGTCKMRDQHGKDHHGEFCFVCRWLIVSRVNPSLHSRVSDRYPGAKKDD